MKQPPCSPPFHSAFPFLLCLPMTCWSVASAEPLALGCLHHGSWGCSCRGRRWQAGQVPSSHSQKLLFCCLELFFSALAFPGHQMISGRGSSPGVMEEVSWRGLGLTGGPSLDGCGQPRPQGQAGIQCCSFGTLSYEQTHPSHAKQGNKGEERTKWERNQEERR